MAGEHFQYFQFAMHLSSINLALCNPLGNSQLNKGFLHSDETSLLCLLNVTVYN